MTAAAEINALTIYLARPGFSEEDLLGSSSGIVEYPLVINDSTRARLFVQRSDPKTSDWAEFFKGYVDVAAFGKNRSTGAALLVKRDTGQFALTFGNGRFLLNSDGFEERFGLKATLNCIGEDTVRSIDKHSLDQLLRHTREQASRNATPREFGFDVEQDLLRAVTGKPIDERFGQRMSGADSLHLTLPLQLSELPELLDSLHDKFVDTSYRTKFPWIDQIAELRDAQLEGTLNDLLVRRLAVGNLDRVWMAVPELISWVKVRGFRFPSHRGSPEYQDIHVDHFLRSPGYSRKENAAALMNRKIVCIDHDGRELRHWSAHKCTYAEVEHGGDSFLLSGGKWYRVKADFVEKTNAAYSRIPDYEATFSEYGDSSESDYLKRICAADSKRFALMDQKNISIARDQSPVEFCDLFTRDGDIIHVKRYGQSNVLSHLFAQGLISGELFQMEERFREEINRLLPKNHRLAQVNERPKQDQFRVVYAIISDQNGALQIPFFSRLNLKHAAKRLEAYGFRVAKAKIPVQGAFSKIAKFRRSSRHGSVQRKPSKRVLLPPGRVRA